MIVCAGGNESFSFAKSIGIGLVQSAINLSLELERNRPKWLCFIGTAGIYGGAELGQIYASFEGANVEQAGLNSGSYSPINTEISATFKFKPSKLLYPALRINSSNFITTDTSLAMQMFEKNYHLENMEFYSVLSVANAFALPCLGLFYSTNFCNPSAHKDFLQNHQSAKLALSQALKELGLLDKP